MNYVYDIEFCTYFFIQFHIFKDFNSLIEIS